MQRAHFFKAAVESMLLYTAETRFLTKTLEKNLDGCYTCLLRHEMNVNWSWSRQITNTELCGSLSKMSEAIRRRLNLLVIPSGLPEVVSTKFCFGNHHMAVEVR